MKRIMFKPLQMNSFEFEYKTRTHLLVATEREDFEMWIDKETVAITSGLPLIQFVLFEAQNVIW